MPAQEPPPQFLASSFCRGIGNNDESRLNCVKERITDRFIFLRQAGHNNVRAQIVCRGEEGILARMAQVGEKQDTEAVDFSPQHEGIVLSLWEPGFGGWVQDSPRPELVTTLD